MSGRKKITSAQYLERAQLLRPAGFKLGAALTKTTKTRITKAWKQVGRYFGEKQKFVFKRANEKTRRTIGEQLAPSQLTPTGFFQRVPKGMKRAPKLRAAPGGGVELVVKGPKGGKYREVTKTLDSEKLADDPEAAIAELRGKRKPQQVILTVNGHDSTRIIYKELEDLSFYLTDFLFPRLLDPNLDPKYSKIHGRVGKPMDEEEIADIFQVKFIHYEGRTKTKKKSANHRRR